MLESASNVCLGRGFFQLNDSIISSRMLKIEVALKTGPSRHVPPFEVCKRYGPGSFTSQVTCLGLGNCASNWRDCE